MLLWDGACAVTGARHPRLLRTSHIVPWADCPTDAESLNVHNGLLLIAHLDATFDADLISFGVNGKIQFSPELSQQDIKALGFVPEMRLQQTDSETEARLAVQQTDGSLRNLRPASARIIVVDQVVSPVFCKVKTKGRHMNIMLVFHLNGLGLIHHNVDEL